MKSPPNWKYQLLLLAKDRDLKSVQEALNSMGHHGWEMVAVYDNGDSNVFVLKHPDAED
jgi:hypothetical protein